MVTTEWPTSINPYSGSFIARQVEQLRMAGIEVEVFHFQGKKNPFRYLQAWFRFRSCLRFGDFDLVHAQWGQSAVLAFPKKLPVVITYRGSDLEGILNLEGRQSRAGRILQMISKSMAMFADEVILVSRHLVTLLPPRSFEIIPSGIDLELFRPMNKAESRRLLAFPEADKIILFAGNPKVLDKRFELAKRAIELARRQCPNIKLFVAYGIPYENMPLYLNASDVLILTSAHEGSPNVVKEALACNLPVVSIDVGDVRERIGGIEGCKVCQDDRPESIAESLIQVLGRKEPIASRATVLELDQQVIAQRVIRIYYRVLEKQHKL
jgi:glycosyltransferase involved in cell wall biosynthesis